MDIVERLRTRAEMQTATGISNSEDHIDWIAADEIELLRKERDGLRNYLRMILWSNRKHLTAEGNHTVEGHKLCIRIAKDALKEWV